MTTQSQVVNDPELQVILEQFKDTDCMTSDGSHAPLVSVPPVTTQSPTNITQQRKTQAIERIKRRIAKERQDEESFKSTLKKVQLRHLADKKAPKPIVIQDNDDKSTSRSKGKAKRKVTTAPIVKDVSSGDTLLHQDQATLQPTNTPVGKSSKICDYFRQAKNATSSSSVTIEKSVSAETSSSDKCETISADTPQISPSSQSTSTERDQDTLSVTSNDTNSSIPISSPMEIVSGSIQTSQGVTTPSTSLNTSGSTHVDPKLLGLDTPAHKKQLGRVISATKANGMLYVARDGKGSKDDGYPDASEITLGDLQRELIEIKHFLGANEQTERLRNLYTVRAFEKLMQRLQVPDEDEDGQPDPRKMSLECAKREIRSEINQLYLTQGNNLERQICKENNALIDGKDYRKEDVLEDDATDLSSESESEEVSDSQSSDEDLSDEDDAHGSQVLHGLQGGQVPSTTSPTSVSTSATNGTPNVQADATQASIPKPIGTIVFTRRDKGIHSHNTHILNVDHATAAKQIAGLLPVSNATGSQVNDGNSQRVIRKRKSKGKRVASSEKGQHRASSKRVRFHQQASQVQQEQSTVNAVQQPMQSHSAVQGSNGMDVQSTSQSNAKASRQHVPIVASLSEVQAKEAARQRVLENKERRQKLLASKAERLQAANAAASLSAAESRMVPNSAVGTSTNGDASSSSSVLGAPGSDSSAHHGTSDNSLLLKLPKRATPPSPHDLHLVQASNYDPQEEYKRRKYAALEKIVKEREWEAKRYGGEPRGRGGDNGGRGYNPRYGRREYNQQNTYTRGGAMSYGGGNNNYRGGRGGGGGYDEPRPGYDF